MFKQASVATSYVVCSCRIRLPTIRRRNITRSYLLRKYISLALAGHWLDAGLIFFRRPLKNHFWNNKLQQYSAKIFGHFLAELKTQI